MLKWRGVLSGKVELAEEAEGFKRKDRQEREGVERLRIPKGNLNFQVLFRFIFRFKSFIFRESADFFRFVAGSFFTAAGADRFSGGNFLRIFFLL